MGYKTISLSEESYNKLAQEKRDSESFSDVILRLTSKTTLRELVGAISDETAVELEHNLEKIRQMRSQQYSSTIESDWK